MENREIVALICLGAVLILGFQVIAALRIGKIRHKQQYFHEDKEAPLFYYHLGLRCVSILVCLIFAGVQFYFR